MGAAAMAIVGAVETPPTFRPVTEDDLPAVVDVRNRSFGPISRGAEEQWRLANLELIGQGRSYGVFDGATIMASGKARGFQQWWNGRLVPMAGMAGIVVSPEYRGRGVGSLLMRRLAEESRRRGETISALYPATVPVYRHLGWEFAGSQRCYRLSTAMLRTLGGSTAVRRATPEDAQILHDLCAASLGAARELGPLQWPAEQWRRRLEDDATYVYLADDGVVVYGWRGHDLEVRFLWADSEETTRTLWSVVGSGSSVAKSVHAYLSPHDPVHWLLGEEASGEVQRNGWMLRILDVPGSLAARGYPPGLAARVSLEVDDPESADNTGTWVLSVEGGRASAERGEDSAALRLSARGLAALYAGQPVSALRRAGLAAGGDAGADPVLDQVFGGSTAHLIDYF